MVGWSALLFALSAVPGTSYPTLELSMGDKMVHLLVYAPLGFLAARALGGGDPTRSGRRVVLLAAGLCALYGASDELHQAFVPFRSPDWRDLLADALGGLLGASASVALVRARRPPPAQGPRTSDAGADEPGRSPAPETRGGRIAPSTDDAIERRERP